MILDDIIAAKRLQLENEKYALPNCKSGRETISLNDAIENCDGLFVIAEIKKASPSKGILSEDFNYMKIANDYIENNVGAISILTEEKFFLGSIDILKAVREICPLPILRKDFIIDEWQIYQSRLIGADVILLIAAILEQNQMKEYYNIAKALDLSVIAEVHNAKDVEKALNCDCDIIGINNRNLNTFHENIKTTEHLSKLIPCDKIIISESGIRTSEDINYLKRIGVEGVLIGEAFMRSGSIRSTIESLR